MTFNEANTVEAFVRDLLCGGITHHTAVGPGLARRSGQISGLGWHYLSHENLPRQPQEALVEDHLSEALIRLNPSIAAQPDRVDDVLYRLRAIIMGVRSDGLVKANEEFAAWLTGEKSMPFGENGEHVTIKLIDFDDLEQNQYVVTQQYTFRAGKTEKRADLVLLVNGIPLVLIEAKTPSARARAGSTGRCRCTTTTSRTSPSCSCRTSSPSPPRARSTATARSGMPVEFWGPWRLEGNDATALHAQVERAVTSMLRPAGHPRPARELHLLRDAQGQAAHQDHRPLPAVEGANKIVERVVAGHPKKGLIWHFQGSGKSLLMLFAARKLRLHPALKNPTVIIVVDRIDLDSQISSTFYAADTPNLVKADSRKDLHDLLEKDVRKIIITTIFKFGEADGVLNERDNIIALVDEAHRTQEGDLGRKMREALPNAFLFGLTGTPINRADKNTFYAFGAEEDANGYMSRYGFEDSIRDGATKELHFEPRLLELHIDRDAIDEAFKELTGGLSDLDRDQLAKTAAKMAVLVKAPERVQTVCADIAQHFQEKVEPNGFGAQVVTFDRESCLLYKQALDQFLPPETSDIVMSVNPGEDEYAPYRRDRDAEEKLLDRFRDPNDPLKIIIVTSKLLTGFDAPILQTMYLDKPLRDHTLLQAICRTNRPYGQAEDPRPHRRLPGRLRRRGSGHPVRRRGHHAGRNQHQRAARTSGPKPSRNASDTSQASTASIEGYEGLIAAQDLPAQQRHPRPVRRGLQLPGPPLGGHLARPGADPVRDRLPLAHPGLRVGQALNRHRASSCGMRSDRRRSSSSTSTCTSMRSETTSKRSSWMPTSSRPCWARRTRTRRPRRSQIKVARRLRKQRDDPQFKALGERLEEPQRTSRAGPPHERRVPQGTARPRAATSSPPSRRPSPIAEADLGKAALTELFEEVRNEDTPIIVERVVNDIDEIVRYVRFDGWQNTHAGEREVKKALRKTLFKYKLHQDQELFDKAYGYIRQYY